MDTLVVVVALVDSAAVSLDVSIAVAVAWEEQAGGEEEKKESMRGRAVVVRSRTAVPEADVRESLIPRSSMLLC